MKITNNVGSKLLPVTVALLLIASARAQIATNWAAFNDHSPSAATHPNATGYRMALTGDGGVLKDISSGSDLSVSLVITHTGVPDSGFGLTANPNPGTPAYNLFNGIVDLGNTTPYGIVGIRSSSSSTVTMTFTNLDPTKRYIFRGASVRGGNYANRWTKVMITGHASGVAAHAGGAFTLASFPSAALTPDEVAWNSGEDRANGTLAGWDEIDPGQDGSFSIVNAQYHGPTPSGAATDGPYGYAIAGIYLAEVGPQSPVNITVEPLDVTVEEFRPFTLSVTAGGSPPPTYQWYKDNAPITGATRRTYTVASAQVSDTGDYYVIAQNPVNSDTSRVARVTVNEDLAAPALVGASGSPLFDRASLRFNEALDSGSAQDTFNYAIFRLDNNQPVPVAGATLSSNGLFVVLLFDTSMAPPPPPGTPIRVDVTGVLDLAGNRQEGTSALYTSLVAGGCAGVLFEAYNTGGGNAVANLTSHPSFPNSPYRTVRVNAADTDPAWAVGDTDPSREAYGGRIRGIFVPPQSGDWVLYLRSDDAGQLFLNPNGVDPAGKVLVARQDGCCNTLGDPAISSRNMQLNLTGGKAYFFEALYKEGVGGDYLQVAARLRESADPVTAIPLVLLGQFTEPMAGGEISISQQPANATVAEGTPATFSVGTTSTYDLPACYQWRSNGVDIAGADGRSFTFTPTIADNGARFSVLVSMYGGDSELSTEAILTVFSDTNGPVVLSAAAGATLSEVIVQYNEPVDTGTAADSFNYAVTGVAVTTATMVNATTVSLALSEPLASCTRIEVTVSAVKDLYNNFINPDPTVVSFFIPIEVLAMDANQQWKYHDAGTDPGSDWNYDGYNDTAWLSGPALLGFEPDALTAAQPLRTPTSAAGTNKTVYFRAHFNLPTDPATVTRLQLRQILDDGAVYYLNGYELYRSRMSVGTVTHTTLANAGGPEPAGGNHPTEGPFDVPRDWLRYGDNLIAVSVHPSSLTSSDYIFGASLTASLNDCRPPGARLSITRSGSSVTINSTGAGNLYRSSSLSGTWILVGNTFPVTLPADQQQQFFEIRP